LYAAAYRKTATTCSGSACPPWPGRRWNGWAKREEQIGGVVESTAGLYGDLQSIAGRSLLEIDGLELPLLDGPAGSEAAE
jgi:hypothetical protein